MAHQAINCMMPTGNSMGSRKADLSAARLENFLGPLSSTFCLMRSTWPGMRPACTRIMAVPFGRPGHSWSRRSSSSTTSFTTPSAGLQTVSAGGSHAYGHMAAIDSHLIKA